MGRRVEDNTSVGASHCKDESEVFWGELDVLDWSVYVRVPRLFPLATREHDIRFLPMLKVLLSLPTFALFEDENVAIHAA
mgnify:CR=1 FL=1